MIPDEFGWMHGASAYVKVWHIKVLEELRNGYQFAKAQFKKGLRVRINSELKAFFHERDSWYMSRLWARYPYRNPWAFVRDASICHEGRVKELIAIARRAFAWRVVQTNPKLDIDNIRKLTYAGQAKRSNLSLVEL